MTTKPQSTTEPHDRIWIDWNEREFHLKPLAGYTEYVRADIAPPASTAPVVDQWTVMRDALIKIFDYRGNDIQAIKAIAYKALPAAAATAAPVGQSDELVDEVQRRMDQVVEAAVEWHQAGREGAEWFEAAEKLGAAIDSLLELRSEPTRTQ